MSATVESLQVEFSGSFTRDIQAATAAAERFADTSDQMVTRTTRTWQTLAASGLDPVATSARKVEQANQAAARETVSLNRAFQDGMSAAQYLAGQELIANRLTQKLQSIASEYERVQAKAQAAVTAANAASAAAAGQVMSNVNRSTGVQATSAAAAQHDSREADLEAAFASAEKLRAELVPLAAAQQSYAAAVAKADAAEKAGIITAEQAVEARQRASQGYVSASTSLKTLEAAHGSATAAAKVSSYQLMIVGDEVHKFADMVLSGGSAMKALAYEAPNAVNALGGVSSTLGLIGSLINPVTLTVAAVVAVSGALAYAGYSAETHERQLASLQTQLRTTRNDYAALGVTIQQSAAKFAAAAGTSTGDATSAAKTISASPRFAGDKAELQDLVTLSARISEAFGVDVPAAASKVTQALRDPAAAAKELVDGGFRGIDAAALVTIQRLQAQGSSAQATKMVLDAYRTTLGSAAESHTPLQRALHDLDQAFNGADKSGHSFGKDLGDFVTGAAAKAVDLLTALISRIKEARAAAVSPAEIQGVTGSNAATTPDATGRSVTTGPAIAGRDERALGIMQVLPSTAKGYGYSADQISNSQDANIYAGVTDLVVKLSKAGGSLDKAIAAYGGAVSPDKAAAYVAGVKSQDVSRLDPSIAATIRDTVTQMAGSMGFASRTDELTVVAQKLALQESGGRQYSGMTLPEVSVTAARARAGGHTFGAPNAASAAQQAQAGIDNQDVLAASQDSAGTLLARQQANTDAITRQQRAISLVDPSDTAEVARLTARLKELRGEQTQLISEQTKLARSAQDQLGPLQAQEGATRSVAEVVEQFHQSARAENGGMVDQAALSAAVTARLKALSAAYADVVAQADRQVAAQQRINAAYSGGARSVVEATNAAKADEEARKDFLPGADRDAAAKRYAATLNLGSATSADASTLARGFEQRDQVEQIAQQTRDLGLNSDAAAKNLALLQERQALIRSGASVDSAASQASLANVAAIQDGTAALQRQKAAMDEVGTFVKGTADTIGNALTSAFATGQAKAVNFGNIVKSVLSSAATELLKLSAINPLMNALTGSKSTTLGDMGGILGKLLGGSGGTVENSDPGGFAGGGVVKSASTGIGSFIASLFHSGGIVGSEPTSQRVVDMSMFDDVRRYHTGGLVGGEVPAILQTGEAVLTPGQMQALGGAIGNGSTTGGAGDTHVHLNIDARGAGPREVDILRSQMPAIAKAAVQDAAARGGPFTKTVRGGSR